MKSVKKTGILLLMAIFLIMLFVMSCSSPSTAPATQTTVASNTPTAKPSPTTAKIVLTMAGTNQETDIKTKAMRQFAAEVAEKTNGQVQINVFPNNQLVKDKDMPTAMPQGLADLAQCPVTTFSGLIPETSLSTVCFVYSSADQYWKFMDGPVGDIIGQKMQSKNNLKFLSYLAQGPNQLFMDTNKTLKTPDDFKGLKMRTPPGPIFIKAFTSLGANAILTSVGELYTALQTNVVSAMFGNPNNYIENKLYEVAPYVSTMLVNPDIAQMFIANLDSWNKLPGDVQQIILTAAKNQENWTKQNIAQVSEEGLKKIQQLKDSGQIKDLYVIPPADVAKFEAVVKPAQIAEVQKDPNMTPGLLDKLNQIK